MFQTKEPHSLLITSRNGLAKFKGSYEGVYKTKRTGSAYVDLTNLNLNTELKFIRANKNVITAKVKNCEFSTDPPAVEMKPKLFDQANNVFSDLFAKMIKEEVCGGVENLANVIGRTIMESIKNGPVELEVSPNFPKSSNKNQKANNAEFL